MSMVRLAVVLFAVALTAAVAALTSCVTVLWLLSICRRALSSVVSFSQRHPGHWSHGIRGFRHARQSPSGQPVSPSERCVAERRWHSLFTLRCAHLLFSFSLLLALCAPPIGPIAGTREHHCAGTDSQGGAEGRDQEALSKRQIRTPRPHVTPTTFPLHSPCG